MSSRSEHEEARSYVARWIGLNHHGTLSDIAGDIAVLLSFAAGLFALATWTLRRRLTA